MIIPCKIEFTEPEVKLPACHKNKTEYWISQIEVRGSVITWLKYHLLENNDDVYDWCLPGDLSPELRAEVGAKFPDFTFDLE